MIAATIIEIDIIFVHFSHFFEGLFLITLATPYAKIVIGNNIIIRLVTSAIRITRGSNIHAKLAVQGAIFSERNKARITKPPTATSLNKVFDNFLSIYKF